MLALALSEPDFAVTLAVPAELPVTTPVVFTVATLVPEVSAIDQVTYWFRTWKDLSLKVPVALNCWVEPGTTNELLGVTASDFRVAELTVIGAVPVAFTPAALNAALIFAVPALSPFTTSRLLPLPPTLATVVASELQVTLVVMSWVVESLNSPVAVKVSWPPTAIVEPEGVTVTD